MPSRSRSSSFVALVQGADVGWSRRAWPPRIAVGWQHWWNIVSAIPGLLCNIFYNLANVVFKKDICLWILWWCHLTISSFDNLFRLKNLSESVLVQTGTRCAMMANWLPIEESITRHWADSVTMEMYDENDDGLLLFWLGLQLSSTSSDSSIEPAEIKELRLSSAHAMIFLSQQVSDEAPLNLSLTTYLTMMTIIMWFLNV